AGRAEPHLGAHRLHDLLHHARHLRGDTARRSHQRDARRARFAREGDARDRHPAPAQSRLGRLRALLPARARDPRRRSAARSKRGAGAAERGRPMTADTAHRPVALPSPRPALRAARAIGRATLTYGLPVATFILLWELWSDAFGVPQLFPSPRAT